VNVESRIHAVERIPQKGPGNPAQFLPIRFAFANKLSKNSKLLLALDALVLSETLGRKISIGKINAAKYYKTTYETILSNLATGSLLHADETQVSVCGKTAYVWVFSNLEEAAYLYAESRDGSFLREMLKDFKGVVVSDFYGAYDSLPCRQQKCLVHLMRDLNDEVLCHPYDEELKKIVKEFAELLILLRVRDA
jgi:hypothetical protein